MSIKNFLEEHGQTADQIEAKETEYYLKNWLPIPKSATCMITSGGGVGKSMLSIQIAIRTIVENPNKKVLLWLTEDPKGTSKKRIDDILIAVLPDIDREVLKNLTVVGAEGGSQLITVNDEGNLQEGLSDYDLIVIDPLIAFYGYADENNNRDARAFMQVWNRTAIKNIQSIVFIHHNNKAKSGESATARGASDFINAVRLVYKVEYLEGRNRKIIVEKENLNVAQILGGKEVERLVMPFEIVFEENGETKPTSKGKVLKGNDTFSITFEEDEPPTEDDISKVTNLETKGIKFE